MHLPDVFLFEPVFAGRGRISMPADGAGHFQTLLATIPWQDASPGRESRPN